MIVALYPKQKIEFSFRDEILEGFDECNPNTFWQYESETYQLYNLLKSPELDNLQKVRLGITIFFDFAFGITNEKVLPNNVKKWMTQRFKTPKQLEEKLYELHYNIYQLYQHSVSELLTDTVYQEKDKKLIIELGADVYRFQNQNANELIASFIVNNGRYRYIDYRIYEYNSMLNLILINSISAIGKAPIEELKAIHQTSSFKSSVENLQRLVSNQRFLCKIVRHTAIYNDKYVRDEIQELAKFIFQYRNKLAYERVSCTIIAFLQNKDHKEIIDEIKVGLKIMLEANCALIKNANQEDFAKKVELINQSFNIDIDGKKLFHVEKLKNVENLPHCIAVLKNKTQLLDFMCKPTTATVPIFILDCSAELRNYYVYYLFSNRFFNSKLKLSNIDDFGAFSSRQNPKQSLKTSAIKKFVTKWGTTHIPPPLHNLLTVEQS